MIFLLFDSFSCLIKLCKTSESISNSGSIFNNVTFPFLQLRDETLPKDVQEANWFSAPSALRVYGQYLNLDTDHNGMLSKEELSRFAFIFVFVKIFSCSN